MADCPPTDMMLNAWERMPGLRRWDPLARHFAVLMVLLNAPCSVGDIKLDPSDPLHGARMRFDMLADERYLERMVRGTVLIGELLRASRVARLVNEAFIPTPNALTELLNRDDWGATAISIAGVLALSWPPALRRRALRAKGTDFASLLSDEAWLRDAVTAETRPASHATATCAMGGSSRPECGDGQSVPRNRAPRSAGSRLLHFSHNAARWNTYSSNYCRGKGAANASRRSSCVARELSSATC